VCGGFKGQVSERDERPNEKRVEASFIDGLLERKRELV